jgi:hypothetical protein
MPAAEPTKPLNIFIASPAAWGLTHVKFAQCVSVMAYAIAKAEWDMTVWMEESTSIVKFRNAAVANFLRSDATHLLFLDVDMAWGDPSFIVRLVKHDKDIVCAAYCTRGPKASWCFRHDDLAEGGNQKNLFVNGEGLVELSHAPTGTMLIKRGVLERLIAARPDLKINLNGDPQFVGNEGTYLLFDERPTLGWPKIPGMRMSDDYGFCETLKLTLPDVKIYCDPNITVSHMYWTANTVNLQHAINTGTYGFQTQEEIEAYRRKVQAEALEARKDDLAGDGSVQSG